MANIASYMASNGKTWSDVESDFPEAIKKMLRTPVFQPGEKSTP